MKRLLLCLPLATFVLFSPLNAEIKNPKKVIINRAALKNNSKEGKQFDKERELELTKFREFAANKEKEITQLEQSLAKEHQAGALTAQDLQDKLANIERLKRRASLEVEDKKYEISAKLQRKENELERKVLQPIEALALKNNWTEVKDTQGNILYAANTLDKTNEVLEALNKAFEAETAKASLTTKKA